MEMTTVCQLILTKTHVPSNTACSLVRSKLHLSHSMGAHLCIVIRKPSIPHPIYRQGMRILRLRCIAVGRAKLPASQSESMSVSFSTLDLGP